jgi:hypothetical protein
LRFYEGVEVLKIEELEAEVLCIDSTALFTTACSKPFEILWNMLAKPHFG